MADRKATDERLDRYNATQSESNELTKRALDMLERLIEDGRRGKRSVP